MNHLLPRHSIDVRLFVICSQAYGLAIRPSSLVRCSGEGVHYGNTSIRLP
jgi:hypothetical protein